MFLPDRPPLDGRKAAALLNTLLPPMPVRNWIEAETGMPLTDATATATATATADELVGATP
ncbi:hypothetical protein [Streptomyces uncialis]|uniref:Uncharacterized protein n=1 Tax=Streptomyces uncialis TaxID=1048205 RepID=A0A1Q4VCH3_9ACTN|nr:hypothetical protein [Streptomyces uncialis]OKH95537.1 hypothetical protein AB852_01570 [Streptomyces uncialis]WTE12070.1 hypothetical protein OG924_18500 [Streptomyces uncialis]